MANEALMRAQTVIAVKETTSGTLAFPATDGSAVALLATDYAGINQDAPLQDNPEIQDTRDVLDQLVDKRQPGSWSIPLLLRPGGSLGSVPQDDVLWDCFMGTKTVNAGTSVVYAQAKNKDSFSLWVKKDHTIFFAKGCVVEQLGLALNRNGGVGLDWSGRFMWMGWAGETTADGAASESDTAITVADAKAFSVGARIENTTDEDDNSGEGYEVTAVDVSTETITISPAVPAGGWADGATLKGFLPSTTTVGSPVESRDTTIDFGSESSKAINSLSLTLNDPVAFVDEITDCPEGYIEALRSLEASVGVYFRKADVPYFYDAYNDSTVAMTVNFGDTEGYQLALALPYTSLSVPQVNPQAPAVMLNISCKGLGSSGEDSMSATFT
jgi:hypothetical protein